MSKHVVIIGAGVSGNAALKLAEKQGFSAEIVCDGENVSLPAADLVIASPGVPPLVSGLYQQAAAGNAEFISELEFGFRYWRRPVLAITGTNGKTTTTSLTAHLLNSCGVRAGCAGNIGRPLSDLAAAPDCDVAVVEVSNFQLELCKDFRPECAALLNLQSDHIDRYTGGFAEYCQVKESIFDHVPAGRQVRGLNFTAWDSERRVTFAGTGLFIDGKFITDTAESDLPGEPNRENLAAAVELILRYDEKIIFSDLSSFIRGINSFRRAPHRIEKVGCVNGITFVNDSKGTNPAAVIAALEAVTPPVVIMLGGLAKGMDFSVLKDKIALLRHAVLYGRDRAVIAGILQGKVPCTDCGDDFEAAFNCAVSHAHPGDTVLLSPGCASMDMFPNYKARGEKFRQLVAGIR